MPPQNERFVLTPDMYRFVFMTKHVLTIYIGTITTLLLPLYKINFYILYVIFFGTIFTIIKLVSFFFSYVRRCLHQHTCTVFIQGCVSIISFLHTFVGNLNQFQGDYFLCQQFPFSYIVY